MKLSGRGPSQGSSISVISHIPQRSRMFKHTLICTYTHTHTHLCKGTSAQLYSSPLHLSEYNFSTLRLHNLPLNRCQATIAAIDAFNKNAMRRRRNGRREGHSSTVGVPLHQCVVVSYLAAFFTSFASTDVVGEKTFFKSTFEESQMLQDEKHPHVLVCVCACQWVSSDWLDSSLTSIASL